MKDIKQFVERWQGRGDEKSETQTFWLELLHNICGVERPGGIIEFEKRVELKHKSFIDGYIPSTRVIIEQKSLDVSLDKSTAQSDGTTATPFEQAKRYRDWLPASQQGRWIVVCNFEEFHIHDMEHPKAAPEIIKLADLPREWNKLQFLTDTNAPAPKEIHEVELSFSAGELVKRLYNTLRGRYVNPDSEYSLRSLNVLCVRIVFLLYAEDSGLFEKAAFHDYLAAHRDSARRALIDLFSVLARKPEDRDPYLDADLKAFPYVNGGLFEEQNIEIPNIEGEPLEIILNDMSASFDWSGISPTIFGAVFESTLNPETRRSGGMHYTSIENIHRVIDPLFLSGLKAELDEILAQPEGKKRTNALMDYQKRLSALKFLDPACGSGNFLTETYLSLRRLENRVLSELAHGQISFAEGEFTPIQVSIGQFYGIEINDFAVSVARTALWIAEAQMMRETRAIVDIRDDVLPLKSYHHIIEGNALRLDWHSVIEKPDYIMGNPPFVGLSLRNAEQQEDMEIVFPDNNRAGRLDYVAAWYKKAAEHIAQINTEVAFVSTNSIVQGEQVPILWEDLLVHSGLKINFAYRPFVWNSEATEQAHVHVVIIGFSHNGREQKIIFDGENKRYVRKINGYLVEADNVFIRLRGRPISDIPKLVQGNKPWDGGNLILSEDERKYLLAKYPQADALIRPYIGSREFINKEIRYCLWLKGVAPNEYRNIPEIMRRLEAVADVRRRTKTVSVQAQAETPMLFSQIRQPESSHFLCVPEVSSEKRHYVPIGYLDSSVIVNNKLYIIPDATLYLFGVLTSSVHMAWMRVVCGRLEMRYSYSPSVYNNFPWPTPTDDQRAKIEQAAQGILDARALYPDSSLADLYDELTMPPELRKAHRANDAAVCAAYGFEKDITEPEVVARLMELYEEMI